MKNSKENMHFHIRALRVKQAEASEQHILTGLFVLKYFSVTNSPCLTLGNLGSKRVMNSWPSNYNAWVVGIVSYLAMKI